MCRFQYLASWPPFLVLILAHFSAAADPQPRHADLVANARKVLKDHCYQCHGQDPDNSDGDGLDILDHAMLLERKLIVAKGPGKSRLLRKVELGMMPPPGEAPSVPADEIKILRDWIKSGAQPFPKDKE